MTRSMDPPLDVLCIGAVLWDTVGRSTDILGPGADVPGKIRRIPGGVAMNIAATLRRFGLAPRLLSFIGTDPAGDALVAACDDMGIDASFVFRSGQYPTDNYMAIEDQNGVVAAIADAHSLEAAGTGILGPLSDGRLGHAGAPYPGLVALDGNLTPALLEDIATNVLFSAADLRVAPASPGKAERMLPFIDCPNATLYLNLTEANRLLGRDVQAAEEAGRALLAMGARRVLITNGAGSAADCTPERLLTARPPQVTAERVTGAGDTFLAAHIAAEIDGADRDAALTSALDAAARYVAGHEL